MWGFINLVCQSHKPKVAQLQALFFADASVADRFFVICMALFCIGSGRSVEMLETTDLWGSKCDCLGIKWTRVASYA